MFILLYKTHVANDYGCSITVQGLVSSPGASYVCLSLAAGAGIGKSDVSVPHTRSIEVMTGSSVAIVTVFMHMVKIVCTN